MARDLNVSSSAKATVLTENDDVPGSKFESEPANYTVEQLKRWLKCRGLKQSGKREDLLARVNDSLKSGNHHILDPGIHNGKWLEAKILRNRKPESLETSIKNVPDVQLIPKTGWKAFPSQELPSLFNYGHVYHYALESLPALPGEQNDQEEDEDGELTSGIGHMTDKPFSNGRKYVDSGFVHDMTDTKTNDYYHLKAHVWPSMKTDFPHNVLVILSVKSGPVIHASCDPCKASELGRFSHVVAVLLSLVDHVQKHEVIPTTPCTSQECTWNKGKKRKKNPQRLSAAKYPSKLKKRKIQVIDFDPRPAKYRKISSNHVNNFVCNLHTISANQNKVSMWETQLTITYSDYNLEDTSVIEQQVSDLMSNLTPDSLSEVEGTKGQNESEKWYSERWPRITASTCLNAYRAGKKVMEGSNSASALSGKYISSNIWNTSDNPQMYWMKYGLYSEADAIQKYESQTKKVISPSGLWVNPKFPFLACSPDGLVGKDGLIEIKSLKLFKEHSIDAVCNDKGNLISKHIINRQCFSLKDNKCTLKKSHSYYYQIQMQLLITERTFCDFVLYAKDGPVSIERIYRDETFITDMLNVLTHFWRRVVAPELFEMRVPRDLLPFVMPSDFFDGLTLPAFDSLSPAATCVNNECDPEGTSNTDLPPPAASPTSPPHTLDSELPKAATSLLQYSSDELDFANFLATCTSETQIPARIRILPTDLVVVPWGGTTRQGITLANTCPVDNWLMIFQALVKSGRINLDDLAGAGNVIRTALSLIDHHEYGEAKLACLPTMPGVKNRVIDLYGNEGDYFLKIIQPFLATAVTTWCSLPSCPSMKSTYLSHGISLGCSINDNTFDASLQEWLDPGTSQCQRKFTNKPSSGIPCHPDTTFCDDGTQFVSWHCSGVRTSLPRLFLLFKNFFLFSVDLISRNTNLDIKDLPQMITLNRTILHLQSATLWNGNHYICVFNYKYTWLIYDGLQESRERDTGLSLFDTHPRRFSVSHVRYTV